MITLALVLVACLVRWQINSHKKCDSQCRMSGKTVLVTGTERPSGIHIS